MTIERVDEVRIDSVRGLAALTLSFGDRARVVVLSGANGTGKTSTCTALSLLLNGPAFEEGARPHHAEAKECHVSAEGRSAGRAWQRTVDLPRAGRKLEAVVIEDGTRRPIDDAHARLPRRASVFFQGDLTVQLAPLVDVLLTEVPEIAGLSSTLQRAAGRLTHSLHQEFPSRGAENPKELEGLRKTARDRFVDAWATVDAWLDQVSPSTPRRDVRAELVLNNGNLPKQWRARLQSIVAALGDVAGQTLSLGSGVAASDVLRALEQTLEAVARLGAGPADTVTPIHLDRALVERRTKLRCVGADMEGPYDREIYELPVDASGLKRAASIVGGPERQVAEYRQKLAWHVAAAGWPAGARASLDDVLSALIEEGPRWTSPAHLGDTPDLQRTVDWVAAALTNAEEARNALRTWHAAVVAGRADIERRLLDEELRLGTMRAFLALGQRLMTEPGWAETLKELNPGRDLDAAELEALLSANPRLPKGDTRPLAEVIDASRAWRAVEARWEAHERAEAEDRARAAAVPILQEALDSLRELAPEKGSGALDRAAGIDERALEGLVDTINRISRHHFRASHILWKLVPVRGGRWLELKALVGSEQIEVPVEGTSTGEQTIAGLSLTIALNLLLESRLEHRVLIFDDFTTAFDLAQLPAVALLLRKLAWNAVSPRQLVLSTHHEEVTNRLLELLAPPPGETLRVVQFQPSERADDGSRPRVELFDGDGSKAGEPVEATDQMFARMVTNGLSYLYREPEEASTGLRGQDGASGGRTAPPA